MNNVVTGDTNLIREAGTLDLVNAAGTYAKIYANLNVANGNLTVDGVGYAIHAAMVIAGDAYFNLSEAGEALRMVADEMAGIDSGAAKDINRLYDEPEYDGPVLQ